MQAQIDRRERTNQTLQEDLNRSRDKAEKLLATIGELQSSESEMELAARRAERELREEREKGLRLERELDGWKSLKGRKVGDIMHHRPRASGQWGSSAPSDYSGEGYGVDEYGVVDIPKRKSSLSRTVSTTKGFL